MLPVLSFSYYGEDAGLPGWYIQVQATRLQIVALPVVRSTTKQVLQSPLPLPISAKHKIHYSIGTEDTEGGSGCDSEAVRDARPGMITPKHRPVVGLDALAWYLDPDAWACMGVRYVEI